MRVMVLVKGDAASDDDAAASGSLLAAMDRFNTDLVKAGVVLAGDGLQPSAHGVRVRFDGDRRTVVDGPFPTASGLVAGFWLWHVRSIAEAVEWVKRAPFGGGTEVEIRPVVNDT